MAMQGLLLAHEHLRVNPSLGKSSKQGFAGPVVHRTRPGNQVVNNFHLSYQSSLSTRGGSSEDGTNSFELDSFSNTSSNDEWSNVQEAFVGKPRTPAPSVNKSNRKRLDVNRKPASKEFTHGLDAMTPGMASTLASSPADFAAAWKVVAVTDGWKNEEPKKRGTKNQKQTKVKSNEAKGKGKGSQQKTSLLKEHQDELATEVPLPKWFAPPARTTNTYAMPRPVGPVAAATQKAAKAISPAFLAPPGLATPSEFDGLDHSQVSALAVQFAMAVGHGERKQQTWEEQSNPGHCNGPLKLLMPNFDCPEPSFVASMPCKKRVPDWSFSV